MSALGTTVQESDTKAPSSAIWALGVTQIIGYGTLYYSLAILAPDIAAEFALPQQWVFGALSIALFLGSLCAPYAGAMADRHGAGRMMSIGSVAAAAALAACALAPNPYLFAAALVAMEVASCFVLYATAFVAIVQVGPAGAQRSITHLTLIAGFASTLFWPLTTFLHGHLGWREVFFVFAAANLLLCLPVHAWIATLVTRRRSAASHAVASVQPSGSRSDANGRTKVVFLLMMAGFAVEGFILSALLIHMVPLLVALGMGTAGVAAATLFGPAQVASRLINMVFGGRLRQSVLAVIAAGLVAAGLATLVFSSPWGAGIVAFVVLFGLGAGLTSIVGGTLPLEAFGREAYGRHVGWMSASRQFTSAFAPFAFASMMAGLAVEGSLVVLAAMAILGIALFGVLSIIARPHS